MCSVIVVMSVFMMVSWVMWFVIVLVLNIVLCVIVVSIILVNCRMGDFLKLVMVIVWVFVFLVR